MESSEKQIKLIEEMIANAKGNVREDSVFYLLWGWLVFVAAAINYVLLNFTDFHSPWIAWMYLMITGGVVSAIIGYKRGKSKKVRTYPERALKYLWLGFVITLCAILWGMGVIGVMATYPILMLMYGFGTFVSGGILKFKFLIFGGIVAWLCGITAFYCSFSDQLLLIMLAIFASYIVPGHLMAKSNNSYV